MRLRLPHTVPLLLSLVACRGPNHTDTLRGHVSSLHHMRGDRKGAEGCHNSSVTPIPLTAPQR